MRRTRLTTAILAIGLALCAGACTENSKTDTSAANNPSAPADEVSADKVLINNVPAAVKSKGELSFAMDASYAPFEYFDTDNKTIIGFDADLATAMATKLGLRAKLVNAGFDSILVGLSSNKYDVGISAFSATPERAKSVDFVVYLSGGSGLGVKTGNPLKLSMDPTTMCGHRISAQKGSLQGLDYLPKFSKQCKSDGKDPIKVQLYPSQSEANLAVGSGRADGVLADSISMALEASQSKGAFELAPGADYSPTNIAVALPNESPLAEPLAAALKALNEDGTLKKIVARWHIPTQALTTAPIGSVIK